MVAPVHLSRPPIVEGLIDLRVIFDSPPSTDCMAELHSQITARYPQRETLHRFQGQIQLVEGMLTETKKAPVFGYRFTSADKAYVFQARVDGITVSRLAPYQTWENLRDEAKDLWEIYFNAAKPDSVVRIAVRYINRLQIPFNSDFSQYLTAPIQVPAALPQAVTSYLTRYVVPVSQHTGTMAIVNQALEEGTGSVGSIILDIDVFREHQFDAATNDWWSSLEELRQFKNLAFFSSITDKTLESIL